MKVIQNLCRFDVIVFLCTGTLKMGKKISVYCTLEYGNGPEIQQVKLSPTKNGALTIVFGSQRIAHVDPLYTFPMHPASIHMVPTDIDIIKRAGKGMSCIKRLNHVHRHTIVKGSIPELIFAAAPVYIDNDDFAFFPTRFQWYLCILKREFRISCWDAWVFGVTYCYHVFENLFSF